MVLPMQSENLQPEQLKIKGYRELSAKELELIAAIKSKGEELDQMVSHLASSDTDLRWVAIGKTHLQEGLMALTRAVAKPSFF